MSIIYEALKKSQHARAAKNQMKVARFPLNKRRQAIIMLLILTCLFFIAATLSLKTPNSAMHMISQNEPAKPIPVKPRPRVVASAPRLMLEGVFLSSNEKLAMINHHTYHEGDQINDMQVVKIAFDQVTLKNKTGSMTLRSALTQLD